MCGIFALIGNHSYDSKTIDDASLKARHRGPEYWRKISH